MFSPQDNLFILTPNSARCIQVPSNEERTVVRIRPPYRTVFKLLTSIQRNLRGSGGVGYVTAFSDTPTYSISV